MKGTRAILVFSAFVAVPVLAEEPPPSPAPPPAAASAAPAKANMVVTKDPETGELRPATAAEREKLLGRTPLARPKERTVVTLPDGSQMVELTDADMTYAVATKSPDGTVKRGCVHGKDAAAKAVASPPAPKASPAPEPKSER